jgi:hypothetical protein
MESGSLAMCLFPEGFFELGQLGLAAAGDCVEVREADSRGGDRSSDGGGGAAERVRVPQLLAAAVEEEQEAAGCAVRHHALGHAGHEVFEEVFEGFGLGGHDPGGEEGPFAAGVDGDVLLDQFAGPGGIAEAESLGGVVAAEILVAVGGALAAAAVGETGVTNSKHRNLQQ